MDSLIRTQYPRDTLYVVGFSDYAREIGPGMLAQLSYNEYVYGTNMQHGLMLARRLLNRHRAGNRQDVYKRQVPTNDQSVGGSSPSMSPW